MQMTYINSSGEQIDFSLDSEYLLIDVQGVSGLNLNIEAQKAPLQDGQTYLFNTLDSRLITLTVAFVYEDDNDKYFKRDMLLKMFNPKLGQGVLQADFLHYTREVDCIVSGMPDFYVAPEDADTLCKVQINLIAHDPYWRDARQREIEIASYSGGLSFPLSLPMNFRVKEKSKKIYNDGHVDAPVTIEFFGPAVNPTVTNETTGEYIKVNKTLIDGDKLIITTGFGNKAVRLIDGVGAESNAFHYVDLQSTFFGLATGINELNFDDDNDSEGANVKIKWKNRYLGV
ncbi:MAG: hypothetical protein GT589_03815 [Peptoclostridium sp.]|uniref:phage tail family protein n=1 Tax=Peptoclostridium sp. TaxID=1904860 RepID=UPI00139C1577|nr:phage tail family protein [Peptoclostridium sp.]MZQ75268.1 hypothetical protein [Peptoclostridium sp.]